MTNKYEEHVNVIQETALNPGTINCVEFELTYQQALSILIRSRQLIQEGKSHSSVLTASEKDKQINKCYKQRHGAY